MIGFTDECGIAHYYPPTAIYLRWDPKHDAYFICDIVVSEPTWERVRDEVEAKL